MGAPRLIDRFGRYPVLVVIYLVVKYHSGMDSVVRVHDHFDHLQAVYSRMSLADLFGSPSSTLDFTLGGLPRGFVGSEFSIGTIIAVVSPLLVGLVLAEVLYRSIAYYGMRRLLRVTGLGSEKLILLVVPSLFAILPFYHPAFASVAGVPLLLSALIRLHRVPNRWDYLIVGGFPVLGMAQATIPYVVLLAGYVVIGRIVKRVPRSVGYSAALYLAVLLMTEWRLVLSLFTGPASNRLDFAVGSPVALSTEVFSMGRSLLEVIEKHSDHASTVFTPVVFLVAIAALGSVIFLKRPNGSAVRTLVQAMIGIVAVMLAGAVWPVVDERVVRPILGDYPAVQLDRFVWLVPGIAYLAAAAAAYSLVTRMPRRAATAAVSIVFLVQGLALWQVADFSHPPLAQLTINEFYAPDTFSRVRGIVEADGGGTVVSVGLDPAVALYNGLDTADGAWSSYPLTYKERWGRLIRPALDADVVIRDYFEGYGNRVYVFQPVFGTVFCCEIPVIEEYELLVDDRQLGALGVDYVLSNGRVTNFSELGLEFVATVAESNSDYRISIYRT